MSMSVHIVFCGSVPGVFDVQAVLEKNGFELSLIEDLVTFEVHSGYLPVRRVGRPSGAAFKLGGLEDIRQIENWAKVGFDQKFDKVANLYFAGDLEAFAIAYAFASAFASTTGGVVIDSEQRILQDSVEALEVARLIWICADELTNNE